MPADVITARQIVQRDRTDTCHEDPFEHALEELEEITIEAAGMRDGTLGRFALLVQHNVGEVVIFIDDQIKGNT